MHLFKIFFSRGMLVQQITFKPINARYKFYARCIRDTITFPTGTSDMY